MIRLSFLIVVCSLCFACEDKNDDKIYSAQMCLNTATDATVDACLAKINGITTPRSYVIRCAADFIRARIDTPTIVEAIKNIDDNSSNNTADPTVDFFENFNFGTMPGDEVAAAQAVTNCTASGSENLQILALTAQTATTIRILAAGPIQPWLDANNYLTLTDNEVEEIGTSILQMQPIACGEAGTFEGTEVCDNLSAAITSGGSDPVAIARQFLVLLGSNND
jgi:phosphohistidine swiveling domain-containing protein